MEDLGYAKTVTAQAQGKDELHITRVRTFENDLKPFQAVGPIRRKTSRTEAMDIFDILCTLPKKTLILFNEIKLESDFYLGIAVMTEFTTYDKSTMGNTYRRLNELIDANLIKKVTKIEDPSSEITEVKATLVPDRFSYMINPYLIKPKKLDLAKKIWELLKTEKQKEDKAE